MNQVVLARPTSQRPHKLRAVIDVQFVVAKDMMSARVTLAMEIEDVDVHLRIGRASQ